MAVKKKPKMFIQSSKESDEKKSSPVSMKTQAVQEEERKVEPGTVRKPAEQNIKVSDEEDIPSVEEAPTHTEKETDWDAEIKKDEKSDNPIKKASWWIFFLIAAVIILGVVGYIAYTEGFKAGKELAQESKVVVTPTPDSPTPTEAQVSKSEHALKVLNGSGISGEASRIKTLLEEKGFTVDSVGNADSSNNKTTTIQAKSSVSDEFIADLKKTLSEDLSPVETEELEDSEEADIVIIIGSGKAE